MEYATEAQAHLGLNVVSLCFLAGVVVDAINDLSSASEDCTDDSGSDASQTEPRPVKRRRRYERKDYSHSQHAQMLLRGAHLDPESRDFRDFRGVFRVPPSFFEEIDEFISRHYLKKTEDCVGQPAVPRKLKVLCCFFIIGCGISFKAMASVVGCDEETLRVFYLFFIDCVTTHLAPRVIKLPANQSELRAAVDTYAEEHLPGCMGSIDCTHIGWVRARASQRSWFIGNLIRTFHVSDALTSIYNLFVLFQVKKVCRQWLSKSLLITRQRSWLLVHVLIQGRITTCTSAGWTCS
jgi:hypothetical protein